MQVTVRGPLEGDFRWSIELVGLGTRGSTRELMDAIDEAGIGPDETVQAWVVDIGGDECAALTMLGFEPYRDLWQLRRPLPAAPSGLVTEAFDPERDVEDFVRVNNRAFAWHPEQGALTAEDVRAAMSEPWFDAEGFRLHRRDGVLAGFCWTKVHDREDPPLGEIYVIAVDPDFHGQGLGGPMTLAGLEYLARRGLTIGMLYVESDNHAANHVYERLGFVHHQTNRAFRRDPS